MTKFILILNGPNCSGKSAVADLIFSRHEKLFRVSSDKIKKFISNYTAEKHREIVIELVVALAETAMQKDFSLVVEGGVIRKEYREKYVKLAKNMVCLAC